MGPWNYWGLSITVGRYAPFLLPPYRVTLRRASTGKSRKEKGSNRLSMGSR